MNATIEFFYAANKNQMPVRSVLVNFGNSPQSVGSDSPGNSLQNYRGK